MSDDDELDSDDDLDLDDDLSGEDQIFLMVARMQLELEKLRPKTMKELARLIAPIPTFVALRRYLAGVYGDNEGGNARTLISLLRMLHIRDPDEAGFWRARGAEEAEPLTLNAAKVATIRVLAEAWNVAP